MIWAALASVCEAWNSPSALMILARFSRSASACLAIARCMVLGSSTSLISTTATLMPHGSVCSSMIFCRFWLILSRFAQQIVKGGLAQRRAQRCLGDLGRGVDVIKTWVTAFWGSTTWK